jgi:23S rRNA (adenine2503-C2)-methyltransferase
MASGRVPPWGRMEKVTQALVGKELSDLTEIMRARGLPHYRASQIYHGLYRLGLADLEKIPSLPAELRAGLAQEFKAGLPGVAQRFTSVDGTVRYLLGLEDGKTVEAVFIPEAQRDTLCISTQVGCPVDCKFCLTALLGLERNLTAGEIVGQVLRILGEHRLDPRQRPVNIVMMGMGEPLLNLPAVLKATRLLADAEGIGIPLRRITVSTSGILPKIEEMGREPGRPRLAVSLNASTEPMRRELMPITRKYPLEALLKVCRRYPLRPWERLSFEYVLLKGVNDSDADARRVVRLLAHINCKVNLIAFNPGPEMPFETPDPQRVLSFQGIVRRSFPCFVRKPRGREIFAACGQLKRSEGVKA